MLRVGVHKRIEHSEISFEHVFPLIATSSIPSCCCCCHIWLVPICLSLPLLRTAGFPPKMFFLKHCFHRKNGLQRTSYFSAVVRPLTNFSYTQFSISNREDCTVEEQCFANMSRTQLHKTAMIVV